MSETFSNELNRSIEVRTATFDCQLKHRAKDDADFSKAGSVKLKLMRSSSADQKPKLMSENNDGELRELIKSIQKKDQHRWS